MGTLDRPRPAAFERRRRTRVCAEAPAAGDRSVDRVPHDRVTECELARRGGGTHQRAGEQLIQRRQARFLGKLRDLGGQPELEWIAGHGGRVEQAARLGREGRQLALERGRHHARDLPVPDGARAHARARTGARELLEEERIATALRVDRGGVPANQLDRLTPAQRPRHELDDPVASQGLLQRRLQGLRQPALAHGDGEQQRSRRCPPDQRGKGVDGGVVCPVDVVETEHEWARASQALEEVTKGSMGAVAVTGRRLSHQRGE